MEALFYVIPFAIILYFVIKRSKKNRNTGTGTGGDVGGERPAPVRPPRPPYDNRLEP